MVIWSGVVRGDGYSIGEFLNMMMAEMALKQVEID